ncbi:MAG: hypothetical protein JSV95_00040 [Gemmatimonadota bacterium]|nr:MAG: hypothetical protein JSV95_00040 [Gemmatimonadota bacterium]
MDHMTIGKARVLVDLGVVASGGVATLLGAYYLINGSFVWIYALAAVVCLAALRLVRLEISKRLMLALVALFASLAFAEGLLRSLAARDDAPGTARRLYTKGYSETLRRNGGPLGYGPAPGRAVQAWKTVGHERVYDVIYTIDEHAMRRTRGPEQGAGSFLFFGGSYVFGEGIEDEETLPFFFSRELGFRYRVLNLGFSGYGPHQMLRSIEIGLFDDAAAEPVIAAIYVGMPSHVDRLAGKSWWDPFGPRYALSPEGSVAYEGPFLRLPERWVGVYYTLLKTVEVARRSVVIDRTMGLFDGTQRSSDRASVDLYVSVIERSAEILKERYGAALLVLFWDDDGDRSARILRRLEDLGIPYRRVSQFMSADQRMEYRVPEDGHPSAVANAIMAGGLADWTASLAGERQLPE